MVEKNFQWIVIVGIIVLILVCMVGFAGKRTKTDAGSSISMFGKPILKSKKLKQSLQSATEEEKAEIQEEHNLKPKAEKAA